MENQTVSKKNQSTPRPSEHPPVMGEKMSKRLGGIKGCKLFWCRMGHIFTIYLYRLVCTAQVVYVCNVNASSADWASSSMVACLRST